MPQYAPFRLCHGANIAELLLEERIADRLGRVDGAHLNSPHTAQISSLFHSHNVA